MVPIPEDASSLEEAVFSQLKKLLTARRLVIREEGHPVLLQGVQTIVLPSLLVSGTSSSADPPSVSLKLFSSFDCLRAVVGLSKERSSAPPQLQVALDRGRPLPDPLYVWSLAARVADRLVLPLLAPSCETFAPQLSSLPSELTAHIAAFLDARDLLRLGSCSRTLGGMASQESLWSPLLLRLLDSTKLVFFPSTPAAMPPREEFRWRTQRLAQLRRVGRARMHRAYASRFEPWIHPPFLARRRLVTPRGIEAPSHLAPFGRRSSTGSLVPDFGTGPPWARSDDMFNDPGNVWDW